MVGSAAGLLFGLLSLNRPLLNALVFYALGFLVGAALGTVVGLARHGRSAPGRATARDGAVAGRGGPRSPA